MPIFYDGSVMPPIMPDLIPSSSWGGSLANLLTRESWQMIRAPHIIRTGGRCQICAERPNRSPDCHEIWAYSMPPAGASPTGAGMQRLISIITVCEPCHEMFHLGLARSRGRGKAAEGRLMETNFWSRKTFAAFDAEARRLFTERSTRQWVLDVTLLDAWHIPLVVDHARWTLHDCAELTSVHPGTKQPIWAAIGGSAFIYDRKVRDPIGSLQQGYEGLLPERGDYDLVRSLGHVREVPAGSGFEDDEDADFAREQHFRDVESGAASGFAFRIHYAEPPARPVVEPPKRKRTFRQAVRSVITALYG